LFQGNPVVIYVGILNLGRQAVKGYAEVQIRDQKNGPPPPGRGGGRKSKRCHSINASREAASSSATNEPHRSRTALRSSLVREVSELQVDLM